jgi:aspartate carbamoyltransferase catalytic subunit
VHSLSKLLLLYNDIRVVLISPKELTLPDSIIESMRAAGVDVTVSHELTQSIADVDIAYSTRIQEERFSSKQEADLYRGKFRLNQAIYTQYCQPNTVIMHPLPRDSRKDANELDSDLDDNPNLAIFRQTDNGVLVRMALFALVLDVADKVDDFSHDVHWYNSRQSPSNS